VVEQRSLHTMPGWQVGGLRTSHSFGKFIHTPSGAVAYQDLALGWSIAKAGGEEGSCADTLFGFTELSQAGVSPYDYGKGQMGRDSIHRLGNLSADVSAMQGRMNQVPTPSGAV
jgi:hypothetical protein